jgi:hypothetical protein
MEEVNPLKLRGYKFLISMNRITIDDVPEPYKQAIIDEEPTT